MAMNGISASSQPLIPNFKGHASRTTNQQPWDNRKKDGKALFFIQQAVDDLIFPRIAAATTSTETCETLKQEYMGDKKVIAVKMQTLRRNFETLGMQKNEKYRVLRSLPPKFDHVVATIKESKDLSAYTFDELMGSLLAYEDRLSRSHENVDEKVLQVKGNSCHKGKAESSGRREYNKNSNRGRGRGRGRGRVVAQITCLGYGTSLGHTKLVHDVQYAPLLAHNLLSVGELIENGYSLLFDDGYCSIIEKVCGKKLFDVPMMSNRMFPLDVSSQEGNGAMVAKENAEANKWHLRYGHLRCVYGKQSRAAFPVGKSRRASMCLELIHSDLCGPMYFKAMVKKQRGCHIKTLGTDRGGNYLSKEFNSFCEDNEIHKELTTPYTPQQNGVVKRKNYTSVEMGRSMMNARGVPKQFWAEAVATIVYILNISPTKAVYNRTPYEAWRGSKPEINSTRYENDL
ncbi:retrovirus-related pol polyprotein from transposon TNT 1-94 [Tanacetum coccineum]